LGGNVFANKPYTRGWKCAGCEDPNQETPRVWHLACYLKYAKENEFIIEEEITMNNPSNSHEA